MLEPSSSSSSHKIPPLSSQARAQKWGSFWARAREKLEWAKLERALFAQARLVSFTPLNPCAILSSMSFCFLLLNASSAMWSLSSKNSGWVVVCENCGVIGGDWLYGKERGGEKLPLFLIYSLICLVNSSFHVRNSDYIFFHPCMLLCTYGDLERHDNGDEQITWL